MAGMALAPRPIAKGMPPNDLRPKLDALVSRYRGLSAHATPKDVEELYTQGCAELLRLETRMLRLRRELVALEGDGADEPLAARDATQLRRLREQLDEELVGIRAVVRLLRTTLDWAQAGATSERLASATSRAAGAA
jgi:hypothetical protein